MKGGDEENTSGCKGGWKTLLTVSNDKSLRCCLGQSQQEEYKINPTMLIHHSTSRHLVEAVRLYQEASNVLLAQLQPRLTVST
jgi:hypothetical protein